MSETGCTHLKCPISKRPNISISIKNQSKISVISKISGNIDDYLNSAKFSVLQPPKWRSPKTSGVATTFTAKPKKGRSPQDGAAANAAQPPKWRCPQNGGATKTPQLLNYIPEAKTPQLFNYIPKAKMTKKRPKISENLRDIFDSTKGTLNSIYFERLTLTKMSSHHLVLWLRKWTINREVGGSIPPGCTSR